LKIVVISIATALLFLSLSISPERTVKFGLSLNADNIGNEETYFLGYFYDDQLKYQSILNKATFTNSIRGIIACEANPKKEDLFEANDIPNCGQQLISISVSSEVTRQVQEFYCDPFDSLWKLKYEKNPYDFSPGWAQTRYRPSQAQQELLKEFGIKHYTQVIWDEHLWKLLTVVQDQKWVNAYKSAQ